MPKGRPDHYYNKAKLDGFAARSVFKLQELNAKYRFFQHGNRVLDLGAAPGSWAQFIAEKVGATGLVVAVDLSPLKVSLSPQVRALQSDVFTLEAEALKAISDFFHVVVSDMAPKTTGDREGDHLRSEQLCRRAYELADGLLRPGGHFVCKMFQGAGTAPFLHDLSSHFELVKTQKPDASRRESRELFIVALRRKRNR